MAPPEKILSTSRVYPASDELIEFLKKQGYKWSEKAPKPIGKYLQPTLFGFKRNFSNFNSM